MKTLRPAQNREDEERLDRGLRLELLMLRRMMSLI